jgi:hypothetical protein
MTDEEKRRKAPKPKGRARNEDPASEKRRVARPQKLTRQERPEAPWEHRQEQPPSGSPAADEVMVVVPYAGYSNGADMLANAKEQFKRLFPDKRLMEPVARRSSDGQSVVFTFQKQ